VAGQLQLQGANVTVYDPKANGPASRLFPTLRYAPSVMEACANADPVLHLTEWAEFSELDPAAVGAVARRRNVVDARNMLVRHRWIAAGWHFVELGRSSD
jgi:UDPglucose 6-dehydrogenase